MPGRAAADAEAMVLGKKGYESVAKGTNGFVCMVERSSTAGFDDPEFGIQSCERRFVLIRRVPATAFH